MAAAVIMGLTAVLLIVLGIVFSSGRGAFLIAGYNTLPEEEQAKYDTIALCKFMGKVMFALAFSMVFWILSSLFDIGWLMIVGIVLFFCFIVFAVAYVNTGNRFKK